MNDFTNALGTEITAQFMGDIRAEADRAAGCRLHERMRQRIEDLNFAICNQVALMDADGGAHVRRLVIDLVGLADEVEALEERARPRTRRERREFRLTRRLWGRLADALIRALRSA